MRDREFSIALEQAGVDDQELTPNFDGMAVGLNVNFDGDLEDTWIVDNWRVAEQQARAILREYDAPGWEVDIYDVYVHSDGYVEDAGYAYRTYTPNPVVRGLRQLLGRG